MDKIELGAHAKLIIENKAFDIIFDKVKEGYMEGWGKTTPNQNELRESIYYTTIALEDVKQTIESLVMAAENEIFKKETEEK